jgi:hypothetical protein
MAGQAQSPSFAIISSEFSPLFLPTRGHPMNASLQAIDHRWGDRVSLEVPAEFKTVQGLALDGVIGNASLSGAFIRTRSRPPLRSHVSVRPLNAASDWLEACVVRHDAAGVGLEWLDPGLRSVSALLARRCNEIHSSTSQTGAWMRIPQASTEAGQSA